RRIRSSSGNRDRAHWLRLTGFSSSIASPPPVAMELESNEAVKQAVMAGLGISFLSLHTIKLELDQELLCVLDVVGAPVMRAWNLTYTLGKYLSPTAEAFRYFILERGERCLISECQEHHLNLMHNTIKP
ncbi:MAG: LysR substrate-binding domain-containing protein, partial [Pseudohongiella sp.]|nr:LysR substrate-binding domain-containing protein [Pseudohongiella sp.]